MAIINDVYRDKDVLYTGGAICSVALTAGNLVYMKSDGTIAKAINNNAATIALGIVLQDYPVNSIPTIYKRVAIANFTTGATPGSRVYLGNVAGGIQATLPAANLYAQVVGYFVNATDVELDIFSAPAFQIVAAAGSNTNIVV